MPSPFFFIWGHQREVFGCQQLIWEEAWLAFSDVFFGSGKGVINGRDSWPRASDRGEEDVCRQPQGFTFDDSSETRSELRFFRNFSTYFQPLVWDTLISELSIGKEGRKCQCHF